MKTKNILLLTLALMAGTSQANWFSTFTNWACNNPKTSLVVTATAMLVAAYWLFKPKAEVGTNYKSNYSIDNLGISWNNYDQNSAKNPCFNHVKLMPDTSFEPQADQISIDGAANQLPCFNGHKKSFYWKATKEIIIFYKNLKNKTYQIKAYTGHAEKRKMTRSVIIYTDDFPTLDQICKIKLIGDNLVIFNQKGQYEVLKGFVENKKLV